MSSLGGEPRVTETGDIVYVFPELQLSASASLGPSNTKVLEAAGLEPDASAFQIKALLNANRISTRGALEKQDLIDILSDALPESSLYGSSTTTAFLEEAESEFSRATGTNLFLAGGLGAVNLGGAAYLANLFSSAALAGVRLPGYYGTIQSAFPFLLGYAVLYSTIPLARFVWTKRRNQQIVERHTRRKAWLKVLTTSSNRIREKLAAASSMSQKLTTVGEEDIYYSTDQNAIDQNRRKEQEDLDEFTKRLNDSTNS